MSFRSIIILTGAGISAESGIATFRGLDGLWENHRIEDVASPEGFAHNPKLVQRFYNLRRAALNKTEPNPAHQALVRLETHMADIGAEFLLVTQNVDDLHERAGSQNLIHMHGALKSALCLECGKRQPCNSDIDERSICSQCTRHGTLRPDIVWFGEVPYHIRHIEAALADCDLFVSIGTSGAVYPAAGFVSTAQQYGARTLELNLEPSAASTVFDDSHLGPASTLVPRWVDALIDKDNR